MTVTDRTEVLTQIIVVQDVKEDPATRNEVIANVAKASVAALNEHYGPVWEEWADSSYTKVVKRAKPKDFAKILALDVPKVVISEHAVAFIPMRKSELPKEVARAQVSGLVTVDDDGNFYEVSEDAPVTLVVNSSLGMSTGKTAAQVAHGLMMFWRSAPVATRWDFFRAGYPVHVVHAEAETFASLSGTARHAVVDNGHTELEPGTATVLVL